MKNALTEIRLGAKGCDKSLLGSHGIVDTEKAISAVQFRAGIDIVDIDLINKASNNGLMFLDEKGIALDGVTKEDEKRAKYKFVPIGYTDKFSTTEICASFMKGKFDWEGIFVGTIDKLIERIMDNYENRIGRISKEERRTVERFKGKFIFRGFGLTEITGNSINEKRYEPELKCNLPLASYETTSAHTEGSLSEFSKAKLIKLQATLINEQPANKNTQATSNIKGNTIIAQNVGEKTPDISDVKVAVHFRPDSKFRTLYDDVYDRLLIKENWRASTKNRMSFYIKSLLEKISCEKTGNESLRGNGYILSENKNKCLFNTGLIDIYNNDIYLIDMHNNESDFFRKEIILAGSKSSITSYGFNKSDILNMPKPVRFYSDKRDLVFDGSLAEFDLEDNNRLNHIIQERRSRFPLNYQTMSTDVLCEKVKSAISKAIRLSERDYKYMVPMYNLKMQKIQYLMPLHLETSIEELPELVIVMGENNGFYSAYTILNTDDAYDNARLICRPDSNWLKVTTG